MTQREPPCSTTLKNINEINTLSVLLLAVCIVVLKTKIIKYAPKNHPITALPRKFRIRRETVRRVQGFVAAFNDFQDW